MNLPKWLRDVQADHLPWDMHIRHSYMRIDGASRADWLREIPHWVRFQMSSQYGQDDGIPPFRIALRKLRGRGVLPTFACIGAGKSGTTDLAAYMSSGHPSLLRPLAKEPLSSDPEDWRLYYPTADEMQKLRETTGHAHVGYFAPALHNVEVADNYRAAVPDAKVVILLRDPVARAWSHFKWDRMLIEGGYASLGDYDNSFAAYMGRALDYFPQPAPGILYYRNISVLQAGIYLAAVRHWLNAFGPDQVMFVASEDYFRDVTGTVCAIQEFIGLDPAKPKLLPIQNENPRSFGEFDSETKRRLSEFYRPWNEQLYELVGRDFGWQ